MTSNIDQATVHGFGDEWTRFDQSKLSEVDAKKIFENYFAIFPWDSISKNSVGFDLGCGSGRWAKFVAPHVRKLYCIDPSAALDIAKANLSNFSNCEFFQVGVDEIPMPNYSMDFGYSLGVLHHIPDVLLALSACVKKLKPGAPFLLYLYYAFDDRPKWFRLLWLISDMGRRVISKIPYKSRYVISQLIDIVVYLPLAKFEKLFEKFGFDVNNFPLTSYRNYSFYVMRTDALDRFGTRLEHRFNKNEIKLMMELAGLENIKFSEKPPYWCSVGYVKANF